MAALEPYPCEPEQPCARIRSGPGLAWLACRASHGDGLAVNRLLRELELRVYSWLVSRLRLFRDSHDLTRDLSQEALIRISRAVVRASFHTDGEVVSWTFRVVRGVLVDHLRAERLRAAAAGGEDVEAAGSQEALQRWEHPVGNVRPESRLLARVLDETLASLPAASRELLRLRVHAGATWKEVARELCTSEHAAKRRYQRLQGALRRDILRRLYRLEGEGNPGAAACLHRLGKAGQLSPGSKDVVLPRPSRSPAQRRRS